MNLKRFLPIKKHWLLFTCFLLAGLLIIIHLRLYQYAFDDAYIHFRVARNLLETGAPYFNTGDPLKVSSSSGWIVFLTIIYWVVKTIGMESNFPYLLSIMNALISTGLIIVYAKIVELFLGKHLRIFQKFILATILLALLLPSSIGLMETPTALLIVGLGIYLLLYSKPFGFVLLGLGIYFRLELSFLVALICIILAFQNKFKLHQIFGYLVLGFTPLVCFDLFYYHTIEPHSIIAKSRLYSLSSIITLFDISYRSLPALSTLSSHWAFGVLIVALFISTIILIFWIAIRETEILRTNPYPALFCFSSLFMIAFYALGHTLMFDWYVPLYMLPISIAIYFYSRTIQYPKNLIASVLLFFLFFSSAISVLSITLSAFYNPNAFPLFESGSRVKMYLAVGNIINEDYPNKTLLTSEIGGLGYSFNGKILDAAGLASTAALSFHPMSVPDQRSSGYLGAIPPEFVKLVNPDIIVSYDTFAEALLRDKISTQYNIVTLPAYLPEDAMYSENKTIWGSKYLRIYIRKPLPVSGRICALSASSDETSNPACTPSLRHSTERATQTHNKRGVGRMGSGLYKRQ